MSDYGEDLRIEIVQEVIVLEFPDIGVELELAEPAAPGSGGGVTDHGALTGKADDDHPQYHNDARGDARYSLLGHEHPDYAHFVYALGVPQPHLMGATYGTGPDTITLGIFSAFNLQPGLPLTVLFTENPDSAYDGGWIYTTAADPDDDTWVFTRLDSPFDIDEIGKYISVVFDLSLNMPLFGAIAYNGSAFSITKLSLDGHTHSGYSPTGHTHSGYSPTGHTHAQYQTDVRESAQEFLRNEWEAWTAPLMVTHPTPPGPSTDLYDATWEVTRATSRGTLPHTPGGIDFQWFGRVLRPWTQAELAGSGLAAEPHIDMYQKFYEILTLIRPSINNDWFEWARLFSGISGGGGSNGRATYFYEGTVIGGAAEATNNVVFDTGVEVGMPERARMTVDCGTSTLTFWNWVPYDNDDPTLEKCPRGLWWKPVFSQTHAAWASMADPETETVPSTHAVGFTTGDPEVIVPWRIGIQGSLEIAEMFAYEYGETTPILAIDADCLAVAAIGATSFLDSTGQNTIETVTAYTIAGPNVDWAPADHNHSGVDIPLDFTQYQSGGNLDATSGGDTNVQKVANKVSALRVLPDPTGQADGKIVKVVSEAWAIGDAPAGGGEDWSYTKALPASDFAYSNLGTFGTASLTHQLTAVNRRAWVPIFVIADTYTRIGLYVSAQGAATTVWRLGLHTDDGGWPTVVPMADYGTVDVSAGGNNTRRDITISQALTTGWYWAQIQVDSHNTSPTVAAISGQASQCPMPHGFPTDRLNPTRGRSGFYDTGGTGGALGNAPASLAAAGVTLSNDAPRIWIWKA